MHVHSVRTCRLSKQWFLKSMAMQRFERYKDCNVLFGRSSWRRCFEAKTSIFGSSISSIFFHFACSIFLFWAFHDNERLTYSLLGAWIPKTLWYNDVYYPFNVISILLILFYVYCFVYSSITHLHVCYRVLIIEKCFYPKNLKELLSNSCLGMEWC